MRTRHGDDVQVPVAECLAMEVVRGRRRVLRNVGFAIAPGELLLVRGTNGSGKTSLMRVLAGIAAPRAGELASNVREVAFVPERPAFASGVRVRDLLDDLRRLRGESPCAHGWERKAREAALDRGALEATLGTLSRGQLQRVALLAALDGERALLVLDEPWESLDDAGRDWLAGALTAAAARDAAVLFSDHSHAAAKRLVLDGAIEVADATARRVQLAPGPELSA